MATHEFIFDDGCAFYCISWTPTDLVGGGVTGYVGNQKQPVTVTYGLGRHMSIGTSFDGSGQVNLGPPSLTISPIQVSVRLACFALTAKARNGCPCKELKPVSVCGMLVD
jgi:hypothetical protein